MNLTIDKITMSPTDKGSGGNKHVMAAKINGFWSVAEKDSGDYVGKHRKPAHELGISCSKTQIWVGCDACLYKLTDGLPVNRLTRTRHRRERRDRYWAEPQV